MRLIRKMIVLGLAGVGLYRLWEVLAPKVDAARGRTTQAREQVEPAVEAAKETLANARDTVRDAATSIVGASRDVADAATDAVVDIGNDVETTAEQDLVSSPNGVPSHEDANR